MRRLLARTLLLLLVVSGSALAQKRGDRSLITRADIDEGASGMLTAQDAIQHLRPNWLRPPRTQLLRGDDGRRQREVERGDHLHR